jgi:hypothetical protein
MGHAAQQGRLYHLWWHPEDFGEHATQNMEFLGYILDCYDLLRTKEGMRSLNMGEVAQLAPASLPPVAL